MLMHSSAEVSAIPSLPRTAITYNTWMLVLRDFFWIWNLGRVNALWPYASQTKASTWGCLPLFLPSDGRVTRGRFLLLASSKNKEWWGQLWSRFCKDKEWWWSALKRINKFWADLFSKIRHQHVNSWHK
jgi:hypothetical protein